ncbi:phospholipid-translocating ATPase rsb1 [Neocucurbitaria cava]|uniref:Phospholipid-translocating ATPase rsb1 n=1 Tax=Neocucurbitaria cava TaxID=798079 RepID=A0A9W8YDJ4_9PLEO|nr:phospholipid-translocating ATPase rsb1 [Neocucurbitaria cava]
MNQAEDVEVILGHERRYKFHSGTLARNSTLFADMFTEPNAAKLNSRARNAGIKIRWMIELTRLPCEQYPAGCLELVELTPNGERADGRSGLVVNENGRIPQAHKAFAYYEAIFYAFYNKELSIDDTDMTAALSDCYTLLKISDYLGCTSIISKPIEVALLKQGQDLFRAIAAKPSAWVEMAYRIRSESVFRECMIHLVGNWRVHKLSPSTLDQLREIPGLRALIEKYHRALLQKGKDLEIVILSNYPGNMALPADDLPIKREAYAKDILIWMALTFYRHWVGQRLINDKGRHAPDSGYDLYKALGTGGDAYMGKAVTNQFHVKFPMTKKAMNVLENHVLEIKACMKKLVQESGILKWNCQLDCHRFPVKYLTCTEFARADYPWLNADVWAHPRSLAVVKKREYKPGGNDIARQNLDTARMFQGRGASAEMEVDEEEEEGGMVEGSEMEDVQGDHQMAKRARVE